MNFGDLLESTMLESGFVRSMDNFYIRGVGITRDTDFVGSPMIDIVSGLIYGTPKSDGNVKRFYFHRPRRKYKNCPKCNKVIGRKSRFRMQAIIQLVGNKRANIVVQITHRGLVSLTDQHREFCDLIDMAHPDSLDKIREIAEAWMPPT